MECSFHQDDYKSSFLGVMSAEGSRIQGKCKPIITESKSVQTACQSTRQLKITRRSASIQLVLPIAQIFAMAAQADLWGFLQPTWVDLSRGSQRFSFSMSMNDVTLITWKCSYSNSEIILPLLHGTILNPGPRSSTSILGSQNLQQ